MKELNEKEVNLVSGGSFCGPDFSDVTATVSSTASIISIGSGSGVSSGCLGVWWKALVN